MPQRPPPWRRWPCRVRRLIRRLVYASQPSTRFSGAARTRSTLFNGERIDPGMDVVSFYADQTAVDGDLTRAVADRYRIRVCRTIAEAMQPGVDAVLSIGEHGEYSTNALGRSSIRASGSSMSA